MYLMIYFNVVSIFVLFLLLVFIFFFFEQKTAYELRISDWSSDVCSSDLFPLMSVIRMKASDDEAKPLSGGGMDRVVERRGLSKPIKLGIGGEIGRASCRERVCQYV